MSRRRSLGRRPPSDWKHVESYPLSALPPRQVPRGVPVVLGINWYENFDRPQRDGTRYWIGRGDLGSIRGGHAICCKPNGIEDPRAWWTYYNQGSSEACVGFSWSRAMSLLNRRRYVAPWLYEQAQLVDEYPDTPPAGGSSVRAGGDVLRVQGHERIYRGKTYPPNPNEGITANRWATSADEVRSALDLPSSHPGIPLLQSWGTGYPHIVYLPDEVLDRLLREDGEAAIPTDR